MDDESRALLLEQLSSQLSAASAPPFLFVGSGFSRRYLGLPSWSGLLESFCADIKPYKYYLSASNGDLAQVASLMAADFFEHAWADKEMSSQLEDLDIVAKEDVLKIFISKYISEQYEAGSYECDYPEEIQKLEGLSVDAIITTNWDCYLEDIFPEYSTYVGQDEIVVANPHGVGEIYKIHGCVKRPETLVLTKGDYNEFDKKYAYLAAKLITYLIEHPIVFMGYSLQDDNIKNVIESLAACLGESVQDRLRNNIIFVQRNGVGRKEGVETTQFKVNDHNVPLTTVTTDDYGVVFDAISSVKRKIPAKILRFLKEEIYRIAKSSNPERRIYVSDIDDIENNEDVEFVVGVGVKELHDQGVEAQAARVGYHQIGIYDVLEDVVESADDQSRFANVEEFVRGTICFHLSRSPYTPIFKYLRLLGVTDDKGYRESGYDLSKAYERDFDDFHLKKHAYATAGEGMDLAEVVQTFPPKKAAMVIPHLALDDIDVEELKAFLVTYREWNSEESDERSSYRKLVAVYDRLKYGWID